MNSKHAFLVLSTFTLVSIAYGEREVFAPTKLAPVVDAGAIQFTDGNVTTPAITFKNDPDTGISRLGSNTLSLISGGVAKAHIGAAGTPNITIGNNPDTSSVATGGVIRATSGGGTDVAGGNLTIQGGNSTGNAAGGYLAFQTAAAGASGSTANTLTERMRITSAGGVYFGNGESSATPTSSEIRATNGSGTNINGANLSIYGGVGTGSGNGGVVAFFTAPAGTSGTGLNSTVERMRITSAGNVMVGNGEVAASVANGNIRATGGSGTNIAGADLVLHGGQSTGNATGGALRFFTAPAGGSGSSVNASIERMQIDSAGDVFVGNGRSSGSPAAAAIRGTAASGTNVAAQDLTLAPGQGTGTGAGGALRILTAAAGTSGSSVNSLTERMRINSAGDVIAGNGDTSATPANATIRGTDGSGTNIAGADMTIRGGQSTGSATGGNIILSTSGNSVSGSSLNAPVERMRVKSTGAVRFIPRGTPGSPEDGDVYYNSGTNKLQVRAAGVWVDLH